MEIPPPPPHLSADDIREKKYEKGDKNLAENLKNKGKSNIKGNLNLTELMGKTQKIG